MNPQEKQPDNELIIPNEITTGKHLENIEKIAIKVNDLRDLSERSFDLEKFLTVIERLKSEGLYKISREFQDSDYGKYMSVIASSESDHWDEAIQTAKAIEITLTTPANRGFEFMKGKTDVEVKILMNEKEGRIFYFQFKDGKYRQGGWDDVHFQKRLSDTEESQDFTLEVEPKPKELE